MYTDLVNPLCSCPGSGGKNFTMKRKARSLVSSRSRAERRGGTTWTSPACSQNLNLYYAQVPPYSLATHTTHACTHTLTHIHTQHTLLWSNLLLICFDNGLSSSSLL